MVLTQHYFTWMFQDPEWKNKFLVGSLLVLAGFVPLLGLIGLAIVFGYSLTLMRAQMKGEPRALPRWDDFGKLLLDGVQGWLSSLGYILPGVLIFILGYVATFVVFFASSIAAGASQESGGETGPFISLIFLSQLSFFFFIGVGLLVYLLGWLVTPVAVGQYLRTGYIGDGYRWRQVWNVMRANAGGFALAWLVYLGVTWGLGFAVSILYYTIILCCIVPFVMAPVHFYTMLMFAQLFGAAYRDGAQKAGLTDSNALSPA